VDYRTSLLILGFAITPFANAQSTPPSVATIFNFNTLQKGANIYNGLTIGPGGVLYGTAEQGGLSTSPCPVATDGCGLAFQLTPPSSPGGHWTETVLHRFGSKQDDGYYPSGTLTMGPNGVLYGTTAYGGVTGSVGTVFKLTPPASPGDSWKETVIHSFNGANDGRYPAAGLALDHNGVLYGATTGGGTSSFGTVFSLKPPSTPGDPWDERVLHSFAGAPLDGDGPNATLAIGPSGTLFGTTLIGGSLNNGAVFQVTPPPSPGSPWTETVLYSFVPYGGDGFAPTAGVTLGADGVIYGPTQDGGSSDYGAIYQLTPPASPGASWTESVVYSFTGVDGDRGPCSSLVVGTGGVLYGTTIGGTAFELQPPASPGEQWTEIFALALNGEGHGGLVLDADGVLYGTATFNLDGNAFELIP
jgi:uncharacterized repeat protein (TIGR03803 family)